MALSTVSHSHDGKIVRILVPFIQHILDRPSQGHYYLDGQEVAQLSDTDLTYTRNYKIGFIFQQFHLLPQLTALENVVLPMIYANVPVQERQRRSKMQP